MLNTFSKLMVAAGFALCAGIVAAKTGAPVKLEYIQKQQYQAGAPVEITVTLAPATSVDRVEVQFRGSDGLVLLSGQQLALGSAAAGERIDHRIKLSAAADGRYYLSAVIRTSTQGNLLARVVSVPVVIGDAARMAKPSVGSATRLDAAGERIKSLPAAEPNK
jgi:uncharacterized protein (DUF58 family)